MGPDEEKLKRLMEESRRLTERLREVEREIARHVGEVAGEVVDPMKVGEREGSGKKGSKD